MDALDGWKHCNFCGGRVDVVGRRRRRRGRRWTNGRNRSLKRACVRVCVRLSVCVWHRQENRRHCTLTRARTQSRTPNIIGDREPRACSAHKSVHNKRSLNSRARFHFRIIDYAALLAPAKVAFAHMRCIYYTYYTYAVCINCTNKRELALDKHTYKHVCVCVFCIYGNV